MASKRGKGKSASNPARAQSSRTTRTKNKTSSDVPDVYQSMLVEAEHDVVSSDVNRPLKRRKVKGPSSSPSPPPRDQTKSPASRDTQRQHSHEPPTRSEPRRQISTSLQTVEDSTDSDESDFDFEDVDLIGQANSREDEIEDLSIAIEPESSSKRTEKIRRKPMSTAEKLHRVFVHKLHILCFLQHCIFANGRCNNALVHRQLSSLLTPNIISLLKMSIHRSQFDRSSAFVDGLKQAASAFTENYEVVSSGLFQASWDVPEQNIVSRDYGDLTDRADFVRAAKAMEGSQDLGSQLFCALLRAVGVEARLVCSLQPLPFTTLGKTTTPQKLSKSILYALASDQGHLLDEGSSTDTAVQSSSSIGKVPSARRRLGQPGFGRTARSPQPKKKVKVVRELAFPVFWVEAFNAAYQKWIPVDPVVTHSVGKADRFEPPASYELNHMVYVIAFESDGTARDVTKRYAKAYNAKTRRHRVEATGDEGRKWWKTTMRLFRRHGEALDRDQVEDAEMAQKEAREGMPANIQDFKDHPYYALERHLKRHEVIHPKREVGKANAGTSAKPRMELVYRRRDVTICRSADKWYRLGRIIQKGEQPLKQVIARNSKIGSLRDDESGDESSNTTGLYAPHQTEQYVAPSVRHGCITKNAFGNLDVYVPSMVPAGGTHIRHALARQAARIVRVDYADAVVGFQFKGRHGTAILDGVVVAEQYADGVWAVIEGLEDEVVEEEARARSLEALRLWKRFLIGLRISERVKTYGDGSSAGAIASDILDDEVEALDTVQEAGGFITTEHDSAHLRTAGRFTVGELSARSSLPRRKQQVLSSDEEKEAEATTHAEGASDSGGNALATHSNSRDDDEGAAGAGGFFVNDEQDPADLAGGGFLADEGMEDNGNTASDSSFVDGRSGNFDGLFAQESPKDNPPSTNSVAASNEEELSQHNNSDNDSKAQPSPHNEASLSADQASDSSRPRLLHSSIGALSTGMVSKLSPEVREAGVAVEVGSDNGSMLSHDPEDEDLEPDWLESD